MRIGLFVPCFIDAFHPEVGIATLELLEKLGFDVAFPRDQTCCGQPLGNNGFVREARPVRELFVRNFAGFDAVVCPSSSCVNEVRNKYDLADAASRAVRERTFELVEFLHDRVGPERMPPARFPHRATLHNSCTALRTLEHEPAPELNVPFFSKPRALLARVEGLELVDTERAGECCGFGGTYSVTEDAVSARMGLDKATRQRDSGAEYVVSADTSCLMHQAGCAARHDIALRYRHIAQVLNGSAA
ncbi:MAG: (Fe-S)-binding protein [Gluconacetobacter diazotrophicus]|nr:(Fe-S)-binding protein [Gluconacetobacter diazotrophicus]